MQGKIVLTATASRLLGLGSEVGETAMWEVLCKYDLEYKWARCEILHEFLEKYQVKYINPFTREEEEKVVYREEVREVQNGRLNS